MNTKRLDKPKNTYTIKKHISPKEALSKLQRYCAYQERCRHEIRQKLSDLGYWGEQADVIMNQLADERFWDESRFAHAFASDKFRLKRWGRIKIRQGLKQKRVPNTFIEKALKEEVAEEDYWKTLLYLTEKKRKTLPEVGNHLKLKQKLMNFLLQKGYESNLIWKAIDEVLSENRDEGYEK